MQALALWNTSMTRPIKLWFQIAAFAITIAALLAVAALAIRMGDGLATTTSILTAFFCAYMGMAGKRRRSDERDSTSLSIKDELELRKARARGTRIQFR